MGTGDKIHFWKDGWINDAPLKSQFPDLFMLSKADNDLIKDLVAFGGEETLGGLGWDLCLRRNLFDREVPSLAQLRQLLEHVAISGILEDRRVWLPDSSELFSCKSAFWRLSYDHLGLEEK